MTNLRAIEGYDPDLFTGSELADHYGFAERITLLRASDDEHIRHRADILVAKRQRSSDTPKDGPRGQAVTALLDALAGKEAPVLLPEPEAAPDFEAMTVGELRAAAKAAGVKVSGRKAELVARLSG